MKKILLPFLTFFLLTLAACGDDEKIVIPSESITVDKAIVFLKVGQEILLQASVLPENTTDVPVGWKSEDASVVQVDASGKIRALKEGATQVIATAGGKHAVCKVYVTSDTPSSVSKRTVLVYLAADNNLGGGASVHFAREDVEEMKAGMAKLTGEGFHLLVYKDYRNGIENPVLVELVPDGQDVVEKVVKTYDDRNSVGLAEMKEVFGDVYANPDFQAESYGLVFWSHCEGWIPYPVPDTRWIGQDDGNGADRRMNLSQFVEVLGCVPGLHFDFLMFDACFMQSVETLYELRSFADYFMASPTETPGPGAPYGVLVPLMFVNGAAADMAEAYYQVYESIYDDGKGISNENWTGGVSMAVIRSAALENLAAVTRQCLQEVGEVSPATLKGQVFDYDKRSSSSHVGYYDFQQLMEKLLPAASFVQWKAAFAEALAFWGTTPKNYSQFVGMFDMTGSHGVTHYLPGNLSGDRAAAYRELSWYEAAGLSQLGW